MKIDHARVSTVDQDPELQIDALKDVRCKRIYTEYVGGNARKHPQFDRLFDSLRVDDTLILRSAKTGELVIAYATRSPWSCSWKTSRLKMSVRFSDTAVSTRPSAITLPGTKRGATVSFKSLKKRT